MGAFWAKPGVGPTRINHAPELGFVGVPTLLGLLCLVGGFLGPQLTHVLEPYAASVPTGEHGHGLALWHGFTLPLGLSALALLGGALLFWRRRRSRGCDVPARAEADEFYRRSMRSIDWLAVETTARTQRARSPSTCPRSRRRSPVGHGVLMTVREWPSEVVWFDRPGQLVVGGVTAAAGIMLVSYRGRVRAFLTLGVTGYGTALLFLLHGAPDPALTQVLVETASLLMPFLLGGRCRSSSPTACCSPPAGGGWCWRSASERR